MTYEPYLSSIRAKPDVGKIIATTLDYPVVMDTFGCTPKYLAENGRAARAMTQSYFQALEMIAKEPQKSLRDHGRRREAERRAVRELGHVPALAGSRREPEVLRGELQAFLKEAGQILLEIGIIVDARREQHDDTSYIRRSGPSRLGRARGSRSARLSSPLGVSDARRLCLPTFLADPATMVREGWNLLVQHGFIKDILITIWRVFGGFVLAAAIGIPLGMAMGATSRSRHFSSRSSRSRATCPLRRSFRCSSSGRGTGEAQKRLGSSSARSSRSRWWWRSMGNTRRDPVERPTRSARATAPSSAPLLAAAPEIGDLAPGARLGLDLRDRRRADRRPASAT